MENGLLIDLGESGFESAADLYIGQWSPELLLAEFRELAGSHKAEGDLKEEVIRQLRGRCGALPEGQLVALDEGEVVGMINGTRRSARDIYKFRESTRLNTWAAVSGQGYFDANERDGNVLCCVSIIAKAGARGVAGGLIERALAASDEMEIDLVAYSRPNRYRELLENPDVEDVRDILSYTQKAMADRSSNTGCVIAKHLAWRKKYRGIPEASAPFPIILENGRPLDEISGGYNILVFYKTDSFRGISPRR